MSEGEPLLPGRGSLALGLRELAGWQEVWQEGLRG
jgi:hypothetical protein